MPRATKLRKTTSHLKQVGVEDETMFRLRARCVSGNPVPETTGIERAPRVQLPEGATLITIATLEDWMNLVETWNCPVTVAPREGALPWVVELEDGRHDDGGYIYDDLEEVTEGVLQ